MMDSAPNQTRVKLNIDAESSKTTPRPPTRNQSLNSESGLSDLSIDLPTDSPTDSPCTGPHEPGLPGPEPGEQPQYRGKATYPVKKIESPTRPNGPPEPQPNPAGRHRGVDHTVVEVLPFNFADHNPPNAPFQD